MSLSWCCSRPWTRIARYDLGYFQARHGAYKCLLAAACMQGLELVQQLQSDDMIISSRLVTGAERLVRPAVAELPADGAS